MSPDRWRQVDRIWNVAAELPPSEVGPFLDGACGGDAELRREVEDLLAADGEAAGFLEEPLNRLEAGRWVGMPAESRLGPYRLLRILGCGGMATVYLALRDGDPAARHVALKLCCCAFKDDEVVRRFRHEGQILARLDHPNVARLLDSGTSHDGWPFLVMEYVEGAPVDEYCDGHRLPVEQRLRLFCDLCSAVDHAHRHGLVHRDLKPANVLVTNTGRVKLLDFGIAKLLDRERFSGSFSATRTGVRALTPGYASPEQIRGLAVTPASDVYALGVLLFELLTGSSPYIVEDCLPLEAERIVCEEEVETMSTAVLYREECDGEASRACGFSGRRQLSRRLRGDLDGVVAMALRKEPERRYGSVEEFSEDLRRHLRGERVFARPEPFVRRLSRWGSRLAAGGGGRFGGWGQAR